MFNQAIVAADKDQTSPINISVVMLQRGKLCQPCLGPLRNTEMFPPLHQCDQSGWPRAKRFVEVSVNGTVGSRGSIARCHNTAAAAAGAVPATIVAT
jgi:hypothetical protein